MTSIHERINRRAMETFKKRFDELHEELHREMRNDASGDHNFDRDIDKFETDIARYHGFRSRTEMQRYLYERSFAHDFCQAEVRNVFGDKHLCRKKATQDDERFNFPMCDRHAQIAWDCLDADDRLLANAY